MAVFRAVTATNAHTKIIIPDIHRLGEAATVCRRAANTAIIRRVDTKVVMVATKIEIITTSNPTTHAGNKEISRTGNSSPVFVSKTITATKEGAITIIHRSGIRDTSKIDMTTMIRISNTGISHLINRGNVALPTG